MTEPFTDYLATKFMVDYHGDKEHYEDAFDGWLENLDNGELIEHGNEYIRTDHKRIEDRENVRQATESERNRIVYIIENLKRPNQALLLTRNEYRETVNVLEELQRRIDRKGV